MAEKLRIGYTNGWKEDDVDIIIDMVNISPYLWYVELYGSNLLQFPYMDNLFSVLITKNITKLTLSDTYFGRDFKRLKPLILSPHLEILKFNHIDNMSVYLPDLVKLLPKSNIKKLDLSYNTDLNRISDKLHTLVIKMVNNSHIDIFYIQRCINDWHINRLARGIKRTTPYKLLLHNKYSRFTEIDGLAAVKWLTENPQVLQITKNKNALVYDIQKRNKRWCKSVAQYCHDHYYNILDLHNLGGSPNKITSHRPLLQIIAQKTISYDYLTLVKIVLKRKYFDIIEFDNRLILVVMTIMGALYLYFILF